MRSSRSPKSRHAAIIGRGGERGTKAAGLSLQRYTAGVRDFRECPRCATTVAFAAGYARDQRGDGLERAGATLQGARRRLERVGDAPVGVTGY